ncbi:MAG: carbohydrate binding family 9 domain-containing protein [Acidobacteria bacterium]|nr:carbohydrate binding family 9 domain-containing protein [Acidobacteriota bacterium]
MARLAACASGSLVTAFAAALLLGAAAAAGPLAGDAARPRVTAGSASGPISLDGVANEAAWQSAGVIADLVQQAPRPGEPTPYRTEVRFLATADALYVAFDCRDPAPERIAVHTMQRDGEMDGDDTVALVLDTFGDSSRGYALQVNAAGARADGLVISAEEVADDWDGIWDARAVRTAAGWSAEIVLPSRTIRFAAGLDEWGFNVQRFVPRDRTTLRWSGVSLDADFADMQRTGVLAGVAGLRQGLGLSIVPYGLVRYEDDRESAQSSVTADIGGDLSYSFTPQLTGVISVNTDFAETEADTRQINLTRFPLFYPEKRGFFLEGSDQFQFGASLGSSFVPFFSRRMGLYAGQQAPIVAGAKVIGRAGRWGLGIVDVLTDDIEAAPGSNLFAGRLTYDVDEHLRLGAIATDGDPDGIHDNSLAGVDVLWRTATLGGDKNFVASAWAAGAGGDVGEGQRQGWGFKLDYPNDLWDVNASVREFGDALDPALGFLPRSGVRMYSLWGAFQPRPQAGWWSTWIRQFFFELEPSLVSSLDGGTESWRVFTAPFNARTHSGEHLEANWAPQFERLGEPFEIANGVVIPAGDYRFDRFRVEVQSSEHRPWRVEATVWFGTFYTGTLEQWEALVAYTTPSGHLQLELAAENDFGHLPEGDFIARVVEARVVYSFNPDLVLSGYGQYDSESEEVGLNTRLRWTITPGTDLFVVWNRGWQRPVPVSGWSRLETLGDQAVVKLRYTWRP